MQRPDDLDCIVIGYNEPPFPAYEALVRRYGTDSEAYRDLHHSFVDVGGRPLTYVDLMNEMYHRARGDGRAAAPDTFKSGEIPNLAAVYLTQYLRRRGRRAEYINLFQHERDRLAAYLARHPRVVAITTTFYVWNFPVSEMVARIRDADPRVAIVVGGPLIGNHARNYPPGAPAEPLGQATPPATRASDDFRLAVQDIGADVYVIEGQGEATLAAIVDALADGRPLSHVPNLAFWQDGTLWCTAVVPENNPLDDNAIDWRGFAAYPLGATLQTRTARSCAFKCAFCNYPARAGRLTLAGLDAVEAELDAMRDVGARQVVFIDDTFNVPIGRFKDLCRMMIRKRYGFRWFSYFRCSNADAEAIDLLAESGGEGVFLGIESGAPSMLVHMNKAATLDKYAQGIEWLHARDVLTFGSFIVGFPGETDDTVDETRRFIEGADLDYYRCQLWYCEPGTPIFQQRDRLAIEGEGFVWRHATMDSLGACDHLDRIVLGVRGASWLPQWSFDFWILPYLLGRGLTRAQIRDFTRGAHDLLALSLASMPPGERATRETGAVAALTRQAAGWQLH